MYAFFRHPLGWLLKSTEYLATREVRRWFRTNPRMREIGLPTWKRILLRLGAAPVGSGIGVGAMQAAVMVAVFIWGIPMIGVPAEGNIPERAKILFDHMTLLLTVQTLIATLTFPMGIALVAFLFGTKDSGGGRRHMLYLADSGAMLVGTSSMLLVLVMVVEDRFFWDPNLNIVEWLLTMDYAWGALNVIGTIYFLKRSYLFVDSDQRSIIIRNYMLSLVWPGQAYKLYKAFTLLASSSDKELVPDGINQFYFGNMWSEFGEVAVSRTFQGKRYLADVNFRTLNLAIWLWTLKLGFPQSKKKIGNSTTEPKLVFPLTYGIAYEGETPLCKVIGTVHPGFLSRLLILLSFRFSSKGPELNPLEIDAIFDGMKAEALDLLHDHHRHQFEELCDEIVDLVGELLTTSEYIGEGGEKGNFALLPRNMFMGIPIYQRWFRVFIEFADAIVPTMKDSTDYFRHLAAYVPQRLLYWTRDLSQINFAREAIQLSLSIFMRLELWWARTVEEKGTGDHGPCKRATLPPPFYGLQTEMLQDFIGAFESMRNHALDGPDDMEVDNWPRAVMHTTLHVTHLQQIVLMLSYAVNLGDHRGADAAADMLQRWAQPLHLKQSGSYFAPHRAWRYSFVDVTNRPLEEVKKEAKIADEYEEYQGNRAAVFIANALENTWADYQCVAVYTLLRWSASCECEESLPADIARNLINGKAVSPQAGTIIGKVRGVQTREELLVAIVRQQQRIQGQMDSAYNNHLGHVFDEIHRVNEAGMISGRPYGGWGSRDLDSVLDIQALYLMILSGGWDPARVLKDYISGLVADDNDHARNLERFFTQMLERINQSDFGQLEQVFNCIRKISGPEHFQLARGEIRTGIEAIIKLFGEQLTTAVAVAEIDQQRLATIASFASRSGFSEKTGLAPLPFFHRVAYSRDVKHEFTLTMQNMDRGEFVAPLRSQLAGNEEDWFEVTTRDSVAGSIMREVLQKTAFQVVDAATPQAYWQEFKRVTDAIREKKLTPVLLLENRVVPKWVWDWALVYRIEKAWVPDDLRVSKDEDRDEEKGYETSFNDVPVYQVPLPTGASIILPLEYFQSIVFKTDEENRCVTATTEPVAGNPTKVNLLLRWGHDIELDADCQQFATRLVYGAKIAEE